MTELVKRSLEDLARRLDERQEEKNRREWEEFAREAWAGGEVFVPSPRVAAPPGVQWPAVKVNEAFADEEAMLLQQFGECSAALARGSGARLNVRCNYGTSILPSLFGVELFMMAEQADTLPTSHPLRSSDAIKRLVDAGVPDLRGGLGGKVLAMGERFVEVLEQYPVLGRHIELYHPDMQGPIDVAEVVWGSEMFYAFSDEAQLLRDFLRLITRTYAAFMRKWYALVPPGEVSAHWGMAHRGRLMIRNDSLMNLSGEIYEQFVRPLDQELFHEFGGGAMHFCGRGNHFIERMSEMRGLYAIHVSQPQLNEMERVYRQTVDKGIRLLGLDRQTVDGARRPLRGRVHCDAPAAR
jgi:hypothetical protein